jgi:hypothetical protein
MSTDRERAQPPAPNGDLAGPDPDERWLRDLGDAARGADPFLDARWLRLARGELTADERSELLRWALAQGVDEATFRSFEPPDAASREEILRDLPIFSPRAEVDPPPEAAPVGEAATSGKVLPLARPAGRAAEPARSPLARLAPWVLAAAAAFALWSGIGSRRPPALALDTSRSLAEATTPLAEGDYGDLRVTGANERVRGAADPQAGDAVLEIGRNAQLEITTAPGRPVAGVAARAYLVRYGRAEPLVAPLTLAGGSVTIRALGREMFADEAFGDFLLVVAVGRPAFLPTREEIASPNFQPPEGFARVLRRRVRYVP